MERSDAVLAVRIIAGVHIAFAALMSLVLFVLMGFMTAPHMGVPSRMGVLGALALLALIYFVAVFAVGVGLWNLRPWARVPGVVVGVLALFSFPIGTAVGIASIWLLGYHADVKALFAPANQAVAEPARPARKAAKKRTRKSSGKRTKKK